MQENYNSNDTEPVLQEYAENDNVFYNDEKSDNPNDKIDSNPEDIDDNLMDKNLQPISKPKKSRKKIIILILVILLCIALPVTFAIIHHNKIEQEKIAKEKEQQKIEDSYYSNLEGIKADMWLGALQSELLISDIHDVWYNTIFEKNSEKTDKYTLKYPDSEYSHHKKLFHDDFNTSLALFFSDSKTEKKIDSIKDYEKLASKIMKELTNPPAKYKDAYAEIKELYEVFIDLTNIAIDPQGNLQSFTSNSNDAISAFDKQYKICETYIPNDSNSEHDNEIL